MYDCVNIDWTINMNAPGQVWVDAAEAAAVLGVTRATLYAYVSRGYVRSQPRPGSSRQRGYSKDDIERMRRRTEERRDPEKAAARALQWGVPVLESAITLIDGHRLYYRGHDATALARSRSVAQVASLVWMGRFDAMSPGAPARIPNARRTTGDDLRFVARAQSMLAAASSRDPLAFDLRPESVAQCGWRILHLLTAAAARLAATGPAVDQRLAHAWGVRGRGVGVLRAALILCADHELNVSAFTARCVASAGSNPYAAVIAGLAALEGTRHGGAGARVESMLDEMRRTPHLRGALAARLRRGDAIEGFGHPLYPAGDPRARVLLDLLRQSYTKSGELRFIQDFVEAAAPAIREAPNLDFALAAVARVLRLPSGSPLVLFAIGRSIGWIGHAIEQYTLNQLIRPRARYVGALPTSSAGSAGSSAS
jgi:citrate synthase